MRHDLKICLVVLLCNSFAIAGEQPGAVGLYGNFERYQFEGNEYFPTEQLVAALKKDVELLPFSRPNQNLHALLQRVEGALIAGYHRAGFAEVSLYATWDDQTDRPVLTISEGPKFLNGDVIIEGVPPQVTASIRKWLTEQRPPLDAIATSPAGKNPEGEILWRDEKGVQVKLEDPAWKRGETCHFNMVNRSAYNPIIERALKDHGYLKANFTVNTLTDLEHLQVDLNINVHRLGSVWEIEDIKIEGLTRHTKEQILELIDVNIGAIITSDLLLKVQKKLQQSGRFRWSRVDVEPKLIPTFPTVLAIQVLEAEYLPALNESFSDHQKAVLQATEWINRFGEQDHDLVIDAYGVVEQFFPEATSPWKVPHFKICLTPSGSIFLSIDVKNELTEFTETFVLSASQERTTLVLEKRKLKYTFEPESISFPNWNLSFFGLPPSSERNVSLNLGFGVSSDPESLAISASPFSGLFNLHKFTGDVFERDQVIEFKDENFRCRIDNRSGRLIELAVFTKKISEHPALSVKVKTEQRAYQRLCQQHLNQNQTEEKPFHEVENLLEFVAIAATQQGETPAALQATQAYAHLFENIFSQEQGDAQSSELKSEQFTIPPSAAMASSSYGIATLAYVWSTLLLPEQTPAWDFSRELIAAIALKDPAAGPSLMAILQDPNNGPVLNWLFAEVTAHIKIVPSEKLAAVALERLETQQYRTDVQQLMNPQGALGATVLKVVKNFRQLSAEETQQLLYFLPPFHVAAVNGFKDDQNMTDEQFARIAFDLLWETTLKEQLRLRLELLHADPELNKLQLTSGEEE